MSEKELRIKLLELQVAALRSVLSEWEEDKSSYTQMHAADAIADVLRVLK